MNYADLEPRVHEEFVLTGKLEIDDDGYIWRVVKVGFWPDERSVKGRAEVVAAKGYLALQVSCPNGERLRVQAHRLVWYHFHGPIPDGLTINHINGIKDDNRPDNLELATHKEQRRHALDVLKCVTARGEKHGMAQLTEAEVLEIRRRHEAGEGPKAIARSLGMSNTNISDICHGKIWSHVGGYISKAKVREKLTPADVLEIRRRVAAGEPQTAMVKAFGINSGTISEIINRKKWKNV